MLQLINIEKKYTTGDLTQAALNGVSLNLRDSEFVAILGPSGSGKTTLLNIIGGLDRYDSGELIINGISTRRYTDRDWDSYRNHTVGFVFQSYNLIPHQTVLANVELALTISGVSGAERRRRAAEALRQVGLGDQLHKRPTEMSGGQMQRVAIARALVNNPDILLADEPTGALDSETSIQVMELLKDVAKDRLVVMVTHNPELAEQYANRIVRLRDGAITDDTRPFEPDDTKLAPPIHKNMGRSSMSWLTSLALSFNNLRTKNGPHPAHSLCGSIGIIGIALIISLSTGVNAYIADMERSTLSEYPLQILSSGVDITSFLSSGSSGGTTATGLPTDEDGKKDTSGGVEGMVSVRQLITKMVSGLTSNDLTSLKKYLDSDESTIADDATSIEYSYSVSPQIYRQDADGSVHQVNPDSTLSMLGLGSSGSGSTSVTSSLMNSMGSNTSVFYQLPANSDLYKSQYDVKAGRWPEKPTECVAVLSKYGTVTDYALYSMGLRDSAELDKMIQQFAQNQNVDVPSDFPHLQLRRADGPEVQAGEQRRHLRLRRHLRHLEEQGRRQGLYAAAGGERRGHHHRGHRPAGLHRLRFHAHLRHRLPRLPDREGHEGRCRQRHREAADGRPRHQRPHRRELRQGRKPPRLRFDQPLLHRHRRPQECLLF